MKEQLITFETAKLAKEKGFNENCDYYGNNIHTIHGNVQNINKRLAKGFYSFPTQSLLQKWLREEYYAEIVIEFRKNEYHYLSATKKGHKQTKDYGGFETYEQALEQALIEALKLI